MKKLLLACFFCIASVAHAAVDVGGMKFEEKATLGTQELQLNGAGLRSRFFVKVYALGLYLAEKKPQAGAADVLASPGVKRLHMVVIRDIPAEQFTDAVLEGVRKNHSSGEFDAIKTRLDEFLTAIRTEKAGRKGDLITIDWLPENAGTRLMLNGKQLGKDIPGEDFYRALLKIWLGTKPAQDNLKDALLGKRR